MGGCVTFWEGVPQCGRVCPSVGVCGPMYTPLMLACQFGHKEVSKLLLEHGELPLYILLKCLECSVPSG